jgi:hypothetical protein
MDTVNAIVKPATALSPDDAARLAQLEATVEKGLHTFVEVGTALAEIRDSRLYRQTHKNFTDYTRERWGISKPYATQLIGAAAVVENLVAIATITPATESQARPLTLLEPEQQREVWQRAVTTAPKADDGTPKVTAAHVAAVVKEAKRRRGGPVGAPGAEFIARLRAEGYSFLLKYRDPAGKPVGVRVMPPGGKKVDDLRLVPADVISAVKRYEKAIVPLLAAEGQIPADAPGKTLMPKLAQALDAGAEPVDSLGDIAVELEHADRRIRELEAEVESLTSGDLARQVRSLHKRYAQLEARLKQELTTSAAAKQQARDAQGLLKKVRTALGVHWNCEILPVLKSRLA